MLIVKTIFINQVENSDDIIQRRIIKPISMLLGSLLSHGALVIVRSPNISEDIIRRRITKPISMLLGLLLTSIEGQGH